LIAILSLLSEVWLKHTKNQTLPIGTLRGFATTAHSVHNFNV
jgi:hypothetical protein